MSSVKCLLLDFFTFFSVSRVSLQIFLFGFCCGTIAFGNVGGKWSLEGECIYSYEYVVNEDHYPDEDISEEEEINELAGTWGPREGFSIQDGNIISGYLEGTDHCGNRHIVEFTGVISNDNHVIFTAIDPAGNQSCSFLIDAYDTRTDVEFDYADDVTTFEGTFDSEKNTITGTYEWNREWFYQEWWDYYKGSLASNYSWNMTSSLGLGTFVVKINPGRDIRFLDKDKSSRVVVGATADGESRVIIQVSGIAKGDKVNISIPNEEEDGLLEDDGKTYKGIFTQTYIAPEEFVRKGNPGDLNNGKRKVDIEIMVNGSEVGHDPLYLFKPPIILIHGLWSKADAFSKMEDYLLSNYSPSHISKRSYPNDRHFNSNTPIVNYFIKEEIEWAKNYQEPKVVKQVDIVAHSMGGILANLCAASPACRNDIHRIITLDTPHNGSEVANFLLHFVFEEMTDKQKEWFLQPCPSYGVFINKMGSMTNGAVEDLQVGSNAMVNYRRAVKNLDVPVYAILGSHKNDKPSLPLDLVYGGDFLMMGLWYWDRALAGQYPRPDTDGDRYFFDSPIHSGIYAALKVEYGLFHEQGWNSDFVVSLESQLGGALAFREMQIIDHISVTDDPTVMKYVCEVLNSSLDTFSRRGFSPSDTYPVALVGPVQVPTTVTNLSVLKTASGQVLPEATAEKLTIVSPTNGEIFHLGDTVTVEVQYNGEAEYSVALLLKNGVVIDNSPPYEFELVVDNNNIGPLFIIATETGTERPMEESLQDAIQINVIPTDMPVEINITPDWPLSLRVGQEYMLYVEGSYPDEISCDITSLSKTIYTSSDANVAEVSSEGVINAKAQGQAVITVENSGVTASIDMEVKKLRTETIAIQKCTVKAGKYTRQANIAVSGMFGPDFNEIADSDEIYIEIQSINDGYRGYGEYIAFNASSVKKGKFAYKNKIQKGKPGAITSFSFDLNKHTFTLKAANIDATGLRCPFRVKIDTGDYVGIGRVDEDIANGRAPIPIQLINGYSDTLRVDKLQVKRGKKPNTDQLAVKGGFAVEKVDVNMASVDFAVGLTGKTFTIPGTNFKANKNKDRFTCSKFTFSDNSIAAADFNFRTCTFTLTIKNTTISSGTANFSIKFASFNEGVEFILP